MERIIDMSEYALVLDDELQLLQDELLAAYAGQSWAGVDDAIDHVRRIRADGREKAEKPEVLLIPYE